MLDPEIRQKGESQEDYVRRISKFPTVHPDTILHVIFPTLNQLALRHIKVWAKPAFPEAFPTSDRNGNTIFNPENITPKEFANWVAEKNMFEVWIALGEKVSPSAELFIELVLGKTNTPTKHLVKPKANQGRWAENNKQKKAARKIAKRLWKQNKDLTIADAILRNDINKAAPNKAESTLRGWIKDLAPSNKPGRREKK
jgi:hypothetical protein